MVDRHVANYDSGLEARALNHIVKNWDAIPGRIKELKKAKKAGNKKTAAAMTAVNTVVYEMLAAQRKEGERQYQARAAGYGGVREVLAKQGLDDLSVKLGDHFPLSAKFDEVMRKNATELIMETVTANSVVKGRKGSAYKVGRKAFTSRYGAKTCVHIAQMGIDVDLYADVANESISKAIGQANEQSTLDVIPHVGDILSNSILMGIERIAHTGNKGTALYGYRLYNLYWCSDGNKKTPHALVCTVVQDLNKSEGYVFKNIENVTIGRGLPGSNAGMSSPVNGDTYTVAQLYDAVKRIDRSDGGLNYSVDDRESYLFDYRERNDGVAYQERSVGGSNREILANAFEEVAQTPYERSRIREYKKEARNLDEQQRRLEELNRRIQEIETYGGPKAEYNRLREEARETANAIDIYDRRLEASEPLRQIVQRERSKAEEQRKELVERHKTSKKREVDSRRRTVMRQKIRKTVRELDKILNRGTRQRNVKDGLRELAGDMLSVFDSCIKKGSPRWEILFGFVFSISRLQHSPCRPSPW